MGGYLERIGTELFHASMRADKMTLGAGDASFGKAQIEQSNNK